jgi:hypothetical protein
LRQINPSKTREFQGKKLGFPWIPLADSGLFNGLWRIQIKKILSLFQPGAERLKPSSAQAFCSGAGVFLPVGKDISHILDNEKTLREKL